MSCAPCNGTGVIIVWNLKDDSGDSVDVCIECGGYGHVQEAKPNAKGH